MSQVILIAAIAAAGITYDWQPVEKEQGSHEHVVTVPSQSLQAALDGEAKALSSNAPDDVEKVYHVRVAPSEGEAQLVNDWIAAANEIPRTHTVTRASFEGQAKRHTVHQQTYPPAPTYAQPTPSYPPPAPAYAQPAPYYAQPTPSYAQPTPAYPPGTASTTNAINQGFQDQATPEQRKTIGSGLASGTGKIIGGTGRVLKSGGEMFAGTAANIGDSASSAFHKGEKKPATAASASPGGYQPYAYNQPTYATVPASAFSPTPTAASAPAPPPPGSVTLPANSPLLGGQSNPWASTNQPQSTAGGQSYQTPQSQPQPLPQQGGGYNASPQYASGGASTSQPGLVTLSGANTSQSGAAMVPLSGGASSNSYQASGQAGYPQRPQRERQFPGFGSSSSSNTQHRPPQNSSPNPDMTARGGGQDSFSKWTLTSTSAPPPAGNAQPPSAAPQTVSYGGSNPGANPVPSPSGWVKPVEGPTASLPNVPPLDASQPYVNVNNPNGGPLNGPNSGSSRWFPLVLVAAIGSIAWNFYLGMNYIDARNKYRAALRRSGKAYAEAFDDV